MIEVPIGVQRACQLALEISPPQSEVAERLASSIGVGEFSDSEWEVYQIWMTRHDGNDGEPDYELLGGQTGQRWIDRATMPKAASLPVEDEPPTRDELVSSAVEFMNGRERAAFVRVWSLLEQSAKSAMRRAVTKASGAIRNEEVKAKMASAAQPLDEISDKIWEAAGLDTSTRRIVASSVDEALETVREVLTEESALVGQVADLAGSIVPERLDEMQDKAIENSIVYLRNTLTDQFENWLRPRSSEPAQVISPEFVRHAMLLAGGADPVEPTRSGFPVRRGHPLPVGFGLLNGPIFFESLARHSSVTAAVEFPEKLLPVIYQWRHAHYRQPNTPFEPHARINGRQFKLDNWEKLRSRKPRSGEAMEDYVESYSPGDHPGCTCAVVPVVKGRGRRVFTADWFEQQLADRQSARAANFNPAQPRCPKGTGITSGRFSNEKLGNCNPMVTQLRDESLRARIQEIQERLDEGVNSVQRRRRLNDELSLAQDELARRVQGGKPEEGNGVTDDPSEETNASPEYSVPITELAELADQEGGFSVRSDVETPSTGFAVSDPEHSVIIDDWSELNDASQDAVIINYLLDKEQIMIDNPEVFLGAWVDDEGRMHLDMTSILQDREAAIQLGRDRDQLAIFDFSTFESIDTEGSGGIDVIPITGQEYLQAQAGRIGAGNGEASSGGDEASIGFDSDTAKRLTAEGWTYRDPFPDIVVERRVQELAQMIHQNAADVREIVRGQIVDLTDDIGGNVIGRNSDGSVNHEIKGIESIVRKIRDRHTTRLYPLTEEAMQAAIKDSLRYTVEIDHLQYTEGMNRAIQRFGSEGWSVVEMDNYWQQGDSYAGINSIWETPTGQRVEIQFHTPEGIEAKHNSHMVYERIRVLPETDPRRTDLWREMVGIWDQVVAPTGWPPIALNTFNGVAVTSWQGPPNLNQPTPQLVGIGRATL